MILTGNWGLTFGPMIFAKEMTNVHIVFEKLDGVTPDEMIKGKIKPGYEHVDVHMNRRSWLDRKSVYCI